MALSKYKPQKGYFLISEPFLADPNFKRRVVLLTEYSPEGAVGFVLNQATELMLNDVLEDFPDFTSRLYLGGPVQQDSLHFIHRIEALRDESNMITPNLCWGGDFEKLKALAAEKAISPNDIRFFLGYAGWGPDQLIDELEQNSWIVAPSSAKFTFQEDTENLWKQILTSMGHSYKRMAGYPEDPSLN